LFELVIRGTQAIATLELRLYIFTKKNFRRVGRSSTSTPKKQVEINIYQGKLSISYLNNLLNGKVVRVPGYRSRYPSYRSRDPAFDSRHYHILSEVVGLKPGPHSLEKLL
jgi:hypothetical protein